MVVVVVLVLSAPAASVVTMSLVTRPALSRLQSDSYREIQTSQSFKIKKVLLNTTTVNTCSSHFTHHVCGPVPGACNSSSTTSTSRGSPAAANISRHGDSLAAQGGVGQGERLLAQGGVPLVVQGAVRQVERTQEVPHVPVLPVFTLLWRGTASQL